MLNVKRRAAVTQRLRPPLEASKRRLLLSCSLPKTVLCFCFFCPVSKGGQSGPLIKACRLQAQLFQSSTAQMPKCSSASANPPQETHTQGPSSDSDELAVRFLIGAFELRVSIWPPFVYFSLHTSSPLGQIFAVCSLQFAVITIKFAVITFQFAVCRR